MQYIKVEGLTVKNGSHGILVEGPNLSHNIVKNNNVSGTSTSGIAIWGNAYTDNTVYGGSQYNARGLTNATIKGNTVTNVCTAEFNECITIANGVEDFDGNGRVGAVNQGAYEYAGNSKILNMKGGTALTLY